MLKQVVVENVFNFKNETILNFGVSKFNEDLAYTTIQKDNISNIAVLYGKNNVGKSNLIKTIKFGVHAILKNEFFLMQNNFLKDKSSIFELTIINDIHEIRYGFEFKRSDNNFVIIDEWMYSKIEHSLRESLIFDRKSNKFGSSMKKKDYDFMTFVEDNELYITYFKKTNNYIIDNFIKEIENYLFMSCDVEDFSNLHSNFEKLYGNESLISEIGKLLYTLDTDIKEIKIEKHDSDDLNNIFDKIKAGEQIIEEELQKIMFFKNTTFGKDSSKNAYSIVFSDEFGNNYDYAELSSGTKQIFKIITLILSSETENNGTTVFLDEIENALHNDIVMYLLKFTNKIFKENHLQLIASTHNTNILDLDFIPNESIVFLKKDDPKEGTFLEYLSTYKIRKEHVLSRRYAINAFDSNPRIIK